MYDARQIANWFVLRGKKDGKQLSIMQLLKLVYISHGWHLEMRGAPLFGNKIEAWQHGPVIPDVYHAFRSQGVSVSKEVAGFPASVFPPEYVNFLEQIYSLYGGKGAFQLSEMTHVKGGPWDTATKSRGWFAPITDDLIRSHYMQLRATRSSHAN